MPVSFGDIPKEVLAYIVAALAYVWRIERGMSDNRKDIMALKDQRAEDSRALDKRLDDLRDDIRGLRADINKHFVPRQ